MSTRSSSAALPQLRERPASSKKSDRYSSIQFCGQESGKLEVKPLMCEVIKHQVWLVQNVSASELSGFRCLKTSGELQYHALCDDFGPMNMACVMRFIDILSEELENFPSAKIAYCAAKGHRELTNSAFLLGAYMIIKRDMKVEDVEKRFARLDRSYIEPYRDATFGEPDFTLSLIDCWRGLKQGKSLGWIEPPASQDEEWGEIDFEEYCHYDDPLNGDLHIVVPGKFVAFKGPKDLGKREFVDDKRGFRYFSPSYYVEIFNALGVTTVVRLNEPEYEATEVTKHGVDHKELEFEDCTSPPQEVVAAFFKLVDAQDGLVAVHCKAGLGRTGTLIALYMMRTYGFGAREAIAWLRIMRPGSVIGEQQHYLCTVEDTIRVAIQSGERPPRVQPSASFSYGSGRSRALAEEVAAGMERRNSIKAGSSFRIPSISH